MAMRVVKHLISPTIPLLHDVTRDGSPDDEFQEYNSLFGRWNEWILHFSFCSIMTEYTHENITERAYVEYQLSRIKHKAPGPDWLPNRPLKDFTYLICDPVAAILMLLFDRDTFPAFGNQLRSYQHLSKSTYFHTEWSKTNFTSTNTC